MTVDELELTGALQGVLLTPDRPTGLGVVVLGGSSGRVDVARARLFAEAGATALAMRWFSGEGQVPGICEIPLESFSAGIDRLIAAGCDKIACLGTSKGAEAALLVAVHDPRVDVVIAISPTSVVWANSGVGRDGVGYPLRSSWTLGGEALPFVPFDVEHMPPPGDGPVAYLAYHERSLARFADHVAAASIPIERARAEVILVAGGDDALWSSAPSANALAARLAAAGRSATLVTHPDAGHRVLLPGETTPRSTINLHGGHDLADAELGGAA